MQRVARFTMFCVTLVVATSGPSAAAPVRVLGGDVITLADSRRDSGDGTHGRYSLREITDERHLAELGMVGAQFNLGVMYANNERYTAAQHWYRKAALRGHREASYNLGLLLLNGMGGVRDEVRGAHWLSSAASRGLPEAQYQLGRLHFEGRGVARDPSQEVAWYRQAAEARYPLAQHDLAVLYHLGEGVPQDDLEAFAWFATADASGFDSRDALVVIGATLTPEQHAMAEVRAAERVAHYARR